MKKAVIVFSGYNQRAVVTLLRTLEKNKVAYSVIAASEDDSIFLTDYGNKAIIRTEKRLVLEDITSCVKVAQSTIAADSYLIAPSTESLNRFLLAHRNHFEAINCEIPLVEEELYKAVSDKESFTSLCRDNDILVPTEYAADTTIPIPCVAKPKVYAAADGITYSPVLINNYEDIVAFREKHNDKDFYFQEFIRGGSYYLLYYIYADGQVDKLSQQNLVQQPEGKSIIAAQLSYLHRDEVAETYEKLLAKLNYRGLIMIEVKCHNGQYYMIEANPRMWGPSQLFVDAQSNLFESLLFDYGAISAKPTMTGTDARYFWEGGLVESMRLSKAIAFHEYDEDRFADEKSIWRAADIYNRKDTKRLYRQELEGNYVK